ncbi:hypothetical protein H5410_026755 [Solanum commersonii]|uniref:Uncharacterized protein n=1 Tax=Solanum commersonii TaxID=4109 RepID=A0A9J5YZZ0_SOLCO|nr:hypothetical protein H5410_026755 [Solanum commersonii]
MKGGTAKDIFIIMLSCKGKIWIELHGDRAGNDDPAMVSDIGSIEGRSYLFIGHQLCNDNPL